MVRTCKQIFAILQARVGNALGNAGVPMASNIAGMASKLGYGRRRGAGLNLAGAGIAAVEDAAV